MDQMMLMMVVGGATFLISMILVFAFAGGNGMSRQARRRLEEIGAGQKVAAAAKPKSQNSARRRAESSGSKLIDALVNRLVPNPDLLRSRLAKTGFKITIFRYSAFTLMTMVVLFLTCYFVYSLSILLSLPVAFAGGLFLPHAIVGFLGKRRINKFMKTFPEAIELMCRGLRAGLPISEAIITVGNDSPDPVGKEFRGIADAMRVGQSIEDGLWDVAKRIDLPDFKFLIIAISIQRETGGNLAETLAGLANTLRKRRQIKLKIKAMSSEARASAWIIGSLPFVMFFLLWLANDGYVMKLIEDPRGAYMIGAGLTLIATGVGIMAKMVRFEI
ncbi:MAG: type II secretion system F family protein [Alphaproteobacteria bacterium]|nr:MAG: type II secretion system F family protein [Alphaproteobacteria bacterium]